MTGPTPRRRPVPAALVLGVLGALTSCSPGDAAADGGDARVDVVAASYPLQYVAEQVGGGHVAVTDLTATGAGSHDLELSPAQAARVGEADVVVHLAGFQPAIDDAIELRTRGHVVDAAQAAALQELDAEHTATLGPCRGATLVTSHEAFGYLAQRYGLTQVAIAGLDPEVEPSPARLRDVIEIARGRDVRTLYFETTTGPELTRTLADDLGLATAVLDPIESLTDAGDDHPTLMRKNLRALREGLACGP